MLDHMLNQMLDHMIIDLVTTALQLVFSLVQTLTDK